ncbi:MAG: hypothetical protein AAGJ35_04160, partial [Myxococcota bacterium]
PSDKIMNTPPLTPAAATIPKAHHGTGRDGRARLRVLRFNHSIPRAAAGFANVLPSGCTLFRVEGECPDLDMTSCCFVTLRELFRCRKT